LECSRCWCTAGCTIGYGDLTPKTQLGRFLSILFIPLACGVTGTLIGRIAQHRIDSKTHDFLCRYKARDLTQDDIDAMDISGTGQVHWAEYLEFMLVAMDMIDYELVDELQSHFQSLDVAGRGFLCRDTLRELAQGKLTCPNHKLKLAAYKERLRQKMFDKV